MWKKFRNFLFFLQYLAVDEYTAVQYFVGRETGTDQTSSVCRTLAQDCKYALVWGQSTKFNPQRVGISHLMADEDVIQVVKK